MNTSIHHQFFYAHPTDVVWEYLTLPEKISKWLMPNDFQLILGHDFQFRTKPKPQFNFDGIFYCKVLEIVPLKKLSYSWRGGPGNGEISLDTVVVWTLVAKDNGTELQLEHNGFTNENFAIYSALNEGWFKNMKKIVESLNRAVHDSTNT